MSVRGTSSSHTCVSLAFVIPPDVDLKLCLNFKPRKSGFRFGPLSLPRALFGPEEAKTGPVSPPLGRHLLRASGTYVHVTIATPKPNIPEYHLLCYTLGPGEGRQGVDGIFFEKRATGNEIT